MVSRVPDATRLLNRLERSGLIARQRDPSDRRFVKTRITAKGLATLGALDRPVQQIHREQLGHIEESELAELIELLARIRGAL